LTQMIRATAKALGSIPYWVVEKDYAISYLLAGIARIDHLSESLILKGGTAGAAIFAASISRLSRSSALVLPTG